MGYKALIRLFIFLLVAKSSVANIDSLKNVLAQTTVDSNTVNISIQLAKDYMNRSADSALRYALQAYKLSQRIGNTNKQATAANIIGVIYLNKAQYDKSLQYHLEAAKLFEETGNKRGVAFTYNNIGSVNFHTEQFYEALRYYKMSLALKLELGLRKEASSTYINLGSIFMKKREYDSCIFYYQLALENAKSNNDEYNISVSLMNLGEAYIDIENFVKAKQYYSKALEISKQRKDQYHMANCYYALGKIGTETKEYSEAEANLNTALQVAKSSGITQVELNIYKYFSKLFEKTGDYNRALSYYRDYHMLSDSIYNIEKTKQIEEMKARYETELKDKQIIDLNKDKTIAEEKAQREKTFRNSLIIAFLLIGIICVILFRNIRLKIKTNRLLLEKNEQIEQHQQEIEIKNKELNEYNKELMTENVGARYEILRSKINPHFLFNSLSTLSTLIIKNQRQALDFVGRFSKLYRNILKSGENKLITLEEEMEFAGHYLYLQRMRFGDSLVVEVDIPPELMNCYIPPFTIQLLIENALKHNIISEEYRLVISVKATHSHIIISNNLQKKFIKETSTGIGQQNIIERYRLLGENIPEFGEKNGYYVAKVPLVKINVAV